jgi:hypothetical protein
MSPARRLSFPRSSANRSSGSCKSWLAADRPLILRVGALSYHRVGNQRRVYLWMLSPSAGWGGEIDGQRGRVPSKLRIHRCDDSGMNKRGLSKKGSAACPRKAPGSQTLRCRHDEGCIQQHCSADRERQSYVRAENEFARQRMDRVLRRNQPASRLRQEAEDDCDLFAAVWVIFAVRIRWSVSTCA